MRIRPNYPSGLKAAHRPQNDVPSSQPRGEGQPTETPQVTPSLLTSCRSALDGSADAVLGPAEDGGWWALGLHDPLHARLLEEVPMSTPRTGRDTLAALRAAGLRVRLLPALRDVDRWTDAIAVAGLAPRGRFATAVQRLGAGVPA